MNTEIDTSLRSTWLDVNGLRIHCLMAGEQGPPVLLLHGGGLDSANFSYRYAIEPLAQRYRVFAPDLPGYGQSDKPHVEYDLPYYVDFVCALLDALNLERVSPVGISMGGGTALGLALQAPERVDRLVAVDSYGLGREVPLGPLGYLAVKIPLLNEITWDLVRNNPRMLRWSIQQSVYDLDRIGEDTINEIHRILQQPETARAFQSFQRNEISWGGLKTDFSARLHNISAPTLIIHGANSTLVPLAWARRAAERIPNAQLHVVPNCGHWVTREQPEEFNRVVGAFLGVRG